MMGFKAGSYRWRLILLFINGGLAWPVNMRANKNQCEGRRFELTTIYRVVLYEFAYELLYVLRVFISANCVVLLAKSGWVSLTAAFAV